MNIEFTDEQRQTIFDELMETGEWGAEFERRLAQRLDEEVKNLGVFIDPGEKTEPLTFCIFASDYDGDEALLLVSLSSLIGKWQEQDHSEDEKKRLRDELLRLADTLRGVAA